MSLKSDTAEFKKNEKKLKRREGDPSGTHFVVLTLLITLVLVTMYFIATHINENPSPTAAQQVAV